MATKSGVSKFLLSVIMLSSTACLDNSVKNLNDIVYLNSSYSVPIGPAEIIAKNVINSYHFQKVDTSAISDTNGFFWYDSSFYKSKPGYFDTLVERAVNFSSISDKLGMAKSLMIRLNCVNGFPASAWFQLYFLSGSQVIDSLFDAGTLKINSASINAEGNIINPFTLLDFDTYLDRFEITELTQVDGLRLYVKVETMHDNIPFIKLYPNYRIDIDLGLRIALDMTLSGGK